MQIVGEWSEICKR